MALDRHSETPRSWQELLVTTDQEESAKELRFVDW